MAKVTTIDKLASLFSAQRQAASALRKDIDAYEAEIVSLQNELEGVRNAPVDSATVARRVDVLLALAIADAEQAFSFSSITDAGHHSSSVFLSGQPLLRAAALGLAVMFGDKERIRAEMIAKLSTDGGLSDDERARETKRLQAAISQREQVLERIHREAEASGVAISRRPDADPAALLAPDSEL